MTVQQQRGRNQQAYRRLKQQIDQDYPPGQFVAIVDGELVANAPEFSRLIAALDPVERNPELRLVVQAGANYPEDAVDL